MNFLLVRAGALGDVLLLRRSVAAIRGAQAPPHQISLLAPAASGAALVGPGGSEVDRLISWDRAEVATLLTEQGPGPGAFRNDLASHDVAVVFSRNAALARNLEHLIPRVVVHDPIPPPDVHAASWYARAAEPLGIEVAGEPPLLELTPGDRAEVPSVLDRLGSGFLAVHPGSGSATKSWPADRFASLGEMQEDGRPWLVVEGPADAARAAALLGRPGAVVARGLSVRALAAVLVRAAVYVGNDSGVSHLAAACGVPTVVLFGPTDPRVWSPVGPDVRVVRSPDGTMASIGIDAVRQVMAAPPAS